ncbi:MAG TPA: ATPase, T2SS/T4P/T4SS family [Acidimicrobiales bacterium]
MTAAVSASNGPAPGDQPDPASVVSPLRAIELSVQERAKREISDPSSRAGRQRLRELIAAEIEQWRRDFRHGNRPHDLTDADGLARRAERNLVGYGPLQPLLEDPDVWEVMINGPSEIFAKRHTGVSGFHDEVFHDDNHVTRTLVRILDDASSAHRTLDPAEGLQDAQLDDGSRLHIVHGDVSRGGHVMVNIRKFSTVPFRRLGDLVERGMLTADAARFLAAAIKARLSIVFAGAPGAGKTTLLSCCAAELDPSLRVVVAEEVFEIDIPLPNVAQMQTRSPRQDRPGVDLRRLVAGFLRMAPDVAVVGEVRDREALPLLLTLSSGVTGYTTIHAGSARKALTRLRFVAQLADTSNELPMSALTSLVSESVDLVVHCGRIDGRPRVTEILAVEDLQTGVDSGQFTATEVFALDGSPGLLAWSGDIPVRIDRAFRTAGIDLSELVRGVPRRGPAAETMSAGRSPTERASLLLQSTSTSLDRTDAPL